MELPEIPVTFLRFAAEGGPPTIKPFGVIVSLGVVAGAVVAMRRARRRGVDPWRLRAFLLYAVVLAFVGAHVFDAICYTPEKLAADPLYLLKLWGGLSSYGGFFGAIAGAWLYKVVRKENVLPYADVACSAFPLAWMIGRAGCAVVHDHPGVESGVWFAVQFPELASGGLPRGLEPELSRPSTWIHYDWSQAMGRFDLGLLEMLLMVPLVVAFHLWWAAKPRPFGFFAGRLCVFYAPARFALDYLRIDGDSSFGAGDQRYAALTPAQWGCFALFALGLFVLRAANRWPAPNSWREVEAWSEPASGTGARRRN